jgi:hypothetical protein
MLGNLDADAGDDTWTLKTKDQVIASGGRYDRLSFTVSKGQLGALISENVLNLVGSHHTSPYPLATFKGLVTPSQLMTMTNDPALLELENLFLEHLLGEESSKSLTVSTSFSGSLRSYPLAFASLILGSALIGMVTMLGVLRFLSPSSNKRSSGYHTVIDESPRGEIEFEPCMKVGEQIIL